MKWSTAAKSSFIYTEISLVKSGCLLICIIWCEVELALEEGLNGVPLNQPPRCQASATLGSFPNLLQSQIINKRPLSFPEPHRIMASPQEAWSTRPDIRTWSFLVYYSQLLSPQHIAALSPSYFPHLFPIWGKISSDETASRCQEVTNQLGKFKIYDDQIYLFHIVRKKTTKQYNMILVSF